MTPSTKKPAKKPRLLINRNFALLWSGQAISIVGDVVFESALVLWITFRLASGQSWEPLAVSGVFLASSAPMLLVRPLAGVFVDRWDKRRTMLRMDAVRAVLVALLILATGIIAVPDFLGGALPLTIQLGTVYVVVALTSTCAQFFNPARLVLTGDIVPEAVQGRAFGLDYTTENLAVVLGPPLAAVLFLSGIHWALLVNSLSFAVSFIAVSRIRPPEPAHSATPEERGNALREFGAGIGFFARSRELVGLTGVICLITLGVGCLNSLMPLYVQRTLLGTPQTYAFLLATIGIGTIFGALVASALVPRLGNARSFWIGTLLLGIDVLALSQVRSLVPALVVAFLAGPPQAFVNVATGPIILKVTPRGLVGRISSLLNPLASACGLVSIALAGYLASTVLADFQTGLHLSLFGFDLDLGLGTITTIFAGAGALALLGALVAIFALRGLDARGETTLDAATPGAGDAL